MCNKMEDTGMLFRKIQDNEDAIRAIRKLHGKRHPASLFCMHCNRRYPCPTLQIIGEKDDSNASRTTED